jgi:hypothetical protein
VKASSLRRFGTTHGRVGNGHMPVHIGALHPAFSTGRSIFTSRVFDAGEVKRVLKSGHNSRKIGRTVQKGPRRGWPIYTLTLEERATCPPTCKALAFCYGNNMQAAQRIVAGAELEDALAFELEELQDRHPDGFMVRLHVLGDFYSAGYVEFWKQRLRLLPALHVFGFTAHDPLNSRIGAALLDLVTNQWDRFALRFSGLDGPMLGSQLMPDQHAGAIQCPAQTDATDCCATCALCWQSKRSIAFARH